MAVLGELAGGVAHDFNNQLAGIMGFADCARQDLIERGIPPDDMIEVINAAERARRLTGQLLAFSSRQIVKPEPIDLAQFVHRLERFLNRVVGSPIDIVLSVTGSEHTVRADPSHLEQLVMNLVVNARDAMPHGGTILIEVASPESDETQYLASDDVPPGPQVRLTVHDTGEGIDEETLARAFEPFFTTKAAGKGTGLGLSTVQRIVQQYQGSIDVISKPPEGATFQICLPRVPRPLEAVKPPAAATSLVERTVLVIDGDRSILRLVERILARHGCNVFPASSANEALRSLAERDALPDLILVAQELLDDPRTEMAEALLNRYPEIPVVMMSGYAVTLLGDRQARGEMAVLSKPFTPDRLLALVRETAGGKGE